MFERRTPEVVMVVVVVAAAAVEGKRYFSRVAAATRVRRESGSSRVSPVAVQDKTSWNRWSTEGKRPTTAVWSWPSADWNSSPNERDWL